MLHEGLLILFQNRPTLAAELLAHLDVELPAHSEARVGSAELSELAPTEYRADLVVLLHGHEGPPVQALIVEVQLRRDEHKRKSWPAYLAGLHARIGCPTKLLVIAPDPAVARWCARPIDLGHPGFVLRPLVLGPESVPVITSRRRAAATPELAVLSAMAHGHEELALDVAQAALGGMRGLDDERTRLYADLVVVSLGDATRAALEKLMHSGTYEYQSDFARKYVAQGVEKGLEEGIEKGLRQGRQAGEAEALLEVLDARGLAVSATAKKRILACSDPAQLRAWLRKAVSVDKVNELFAGPAARRPSPPRKQR